MFDFVDAVAAESKIGCFETPDEIEHFGASVGTARRSAKMGATTERSIVVNQAIAASFFEQWTCS